MKCRDLLAFPGFEEVPEREELVRGKEALR